MQRTDEQTKERTNERLNECREALFHPKYSEQELVAMLLGYKPLPWEANPAMISQHVHSPAAGRLIRHLLQYVLRLLTACHVLGGAYELGCLQGLLGLCLFLLGTVCELVDRSSGCIWNMLCFFWVLLQIGVP